MKPISDWSHWPGKMKRAARRAVSAFPDHRRERHFWVVQAFVLAATSIHYGLELSGRVEPDGLSHDVAMTLYTVPLLYAALIFGWEGAILTGLFAAALLAPATFVWHESGYLWLAEVSQLAIVIAVGLVVAWRVEREARQRELAEQTSQQLLMAQQHADAANKAKSEFLSRMSHELRTPLNVILGFGQLLEMDADDEPRREYIDHILVAGNHLLGLVNEALDLTRAESGRLEISLEPVQLRAVIDEAVQMIAPLAAQRQIRVMTSDTGAGGWAKADAQRLRQVFLNLLSNAIKYSPEDSDVIVTARPAGQGRIRAEVVDAGPGIPADKIGRLFSPFDRLGAEATPIEGTGLGLTIAKAFLEAMGGAIGVKTSPGKGSTFWLELDEAIAAASPRTVTEPTSSGSPAVSSGLRVLYVEDNLANLALVRKVCERRPFVELLTGMRGAHGLELARQQRPDLILLDLHLPDMPGAEVLRQLKSDASLAEIPVVIVSADAIPAQVQRLLDAGAQSYMTKPIRVNELVALLDDVAESLARPETVDAASTSRPAVLVVEDDASLRKLTARILEGQGYDVFTAADSAEAITVCQSVTINLLLTDLTLPGMGGTELARVAREQHPAISVLYVTGHTTDELATSGATSTEALLQKPFTADALVALTRNLLRARREGCLAT